VYLLIVLALLAGVALAAPKENPIGRALVALEAKHGPMHDWTVDTTALFLLDNGVSEADVTMLKSHGIDGNTFMSLTEADLTEFGAALATKIKYRGITEAIHAHYDAPENHEQMSLFTYRSRHRKLVSLAMFLVNEPRSALAVMNYYYPELYHDLVFEHGTRKQGANEKLSVGWVTWVLFPMYPILQMYWEFADTNPIFIIFSCLGLIGIQLVHWLWMYKNPKGYMTYQLSALFVGTPVSLIIFSVFWPITPWFLVDIGFYLAPFVTVLLPVVLLFFVVLVGVAAAAVVGAAAALEVDREVRRAQGGMGILSQLEQLDREMKQRQ